MESFLHLKVLPLGLNFCFLYNCTLSSCKINKTLFSMELIIVSPVLLYIYMTKQNSLTIKYWGYYDGIGEEIKVVVTSCCQ